MIVQQRQQGISTMLCKFSSKCLLASLCLVLLADPLEAFLRSIQQSRPSHHYGSRGKCSQTITMVADDNTAPARRAALRLACSVTMSVLLGEAPRAARAASDVEQKDEVFPQTLPGTQRCDLADGNIRRDRLESRCAKLQQDCRGWDSLMLRTPSRLRGAGRPRGRWPGLTSLLEKQLLIPRWWRHCRRS